MADWDKAMTRVRLAIVAMTVAALAVSPAAAQPQLAVQGPGGTPLGGLLEFGGRDAWVAQIDGNRVHIFEVAGGRRLRTLDTPDTARPGQLPVGFAAHPTEDVVFLCSASHGTTAAVDVKTGPSAGAPAPGSGLVDGGNGFTSRCKHGYADHPSIGLRSGVEDRERHAGVAGDSCAAEGVDRRVNRYS